MSFSKKQALFANQYHDFSFLHTESSHKSMTISQVFFKYLWCIFAGYATICCGPELLTT